MKIYDVVARSDDGQAYQCVLASEEGKLDEALAQCMMELKWGQYGYTVESFKERLTEEVIDNGS